MRLKKYLATCQGRTRDILALNLVFAWGQAVAWCKREGLDTTDLVVERV